MLIEFNSIINTINNSIYSVPFFNKVLSNVIYTAIILSIIAIIVIICIYPCKSNTSCWVLTRLFIYLIIVNTIILASYQSVITNKYKKKYIDSVSDDFITNINSKSGGTIYHRENMKVVPKFTHNESNNDDVYYTPSCMEDDSAKKLTTVSNILDDVEKRI